MAGAVTGVGSLPHADPREAAAFVMEAADLPYLPQLPRRHPEERMLVQWGDGLCGCGASEDGVGLAHGAPPGPRREAFGGAEEMLAWLAPDAPTVKTQATGPVTLALGMLAAGHPGRGLWDCVVEGLVRRVEEHLGDVGRALPDAEVVLVLDEPGLAGLDVPGFPLRREDVSAVLGQTLDRLPMRAGVHCCADTDWSLLATLRPRWLSWDLSAVSGTVEPHAEALAAAVASGTGIVWGIVPSQAAPLPGDGELVERLRRVEEALVVAGARLTTLAEEALFSPGCGLAGLTVSQAEAVAAKVRALAGVVTSHG